MSSVKIEIAGPIPSKKNAWRRKGSGVGLSGQLRAEVDAIAWRIRAAWNPRPPVTDQPVEFFVWSMRKDRDNIYTTVLDCMKAGGMIADDRAEAMNGYHGLAALERGSPERVEIIVYSDFESYVEALARRAALTV